MKVVFTINLDKENAKNCAEQAIGILRNCGVDCSINLKNRPGFADKAYEFFDFSESLEPFDMLITVGGDGTIMNAAKYAVAYDKPLLGINAGRLGFLAGLECWELGKLQRLVAGEYQENSRMMLNVKHMSRAGVCHHIALNDAVVAKAALSSVIDVNVLYGERGVMDYRTDSIIFSTPTGSTAYALSNGGPIADPELEFISLAPICPHSLVSRTLLFSQHSVIKLRLGESNRTDAFLMIDGQNTGQIYPEDLITIKKHKTNLRLISLDNREFYEVVSKKFFDH